MRTIEGKKWYRPREIARLGLIRNSTGGDNENSNYDFILSLIRSGRLGAKDYSMGSKMRLWLVPEDEITRYHNTLSTKRVRR